MKISRIFTVLLVAAALMADPASYKANVARMTGPIYTLTPEGRIFVGSKEMTTPAEIAHALNRLVAAMAKYPLCGGQWPAGHKEVLMDINWQIEDEK